MKWITMVALLAACAIVADTAPADAGTFRPSRPGPGGTPYRVFG